MNRFYQIQQQQYVPVPFNEILQASAYTTKRKNDNLQLMMDAEKDVMSLIGMPGTQDEEIAGKYRTGVAELMDKYTSDPRVMNDPNAGYNFIREARKIAPPANVKKIQLSHASYLDNITKNEAELNQKQLFHPYLAARPDSKWSSIDNGVWTGRTGPYNPSTEYSDNIFDKMAADSYYDEELGTISGGITKEKIGFIADLKAEEYSISPNFDSQLAARNIDPRTVSREDRISIARQMLYENGLIRLQEANKGSLSRDGQSKTKSSTGTGEPLPDLAKQQLIDVSQTALSADSVMKIAGGRYDDTSDSYITSVGSTGDNVLSFASPDNPLYNLSPREKTTALAYQEAINEAMNNAKVDNPSVFSAEYIAKAFGMPSNAKLDPSSSSTSKFLKMIKDYGFNYADFQPGGYMHNIIKEAQGDAGFQAVASVGGLINLGGGDAQFVPESQGTNFFNVTDASSNAVGNKASFVKGSYLMTEKELKQRNPKLDISALKDAGILVPTGRLRDKEEVYAVPVHKKITLSNDKLNDFNKEFYGDANNLDESVPSWNEGRAVGGYENKNAAIRTMDYRRNTNLAAQDLDEALSTLTNYPIGDGSVFKTQNDLNAEVQALKNLRQEVTSKGSQSLTDDVAFDVYKMTNRIKQLKELNTPAPGTRTQPLGRSKTTFPANTKEYTEADINNKFDLVREEAESELQKDYPGYKIVYTGNDRNMNEQRDLHKKGKSKTKVSTHNFGAARDYNIIDKKGNLVENKDIYKKYLWATARKFGLFELADWDVFHIGLVKEGNGNTFSDLFNQYPALKSLSSNKERLAEMKELIKKNPELQQDYGDIMAMLEEQLASR